MQESITPQPPHQEILEPEEPVVGVSDTVPPSAQSNYEEAYEQKITEYTSAKSTGNYCLYDFESINVDMLRDVQALGYTMFDINDDDIPELIFADLSGYPALIDIYTHCCCSLVRIFGNTSLGYRERLHLLSDGRLLVEGSDSAFSASYNVYRLTSSDRMDLLESCFYDSQGTSEYAGTYYTEMTESEYRAKLSSFSIRNLESMDWTLIV